MIIKNYAHNNNNHDNNGGFLYSAHVRHVVMLAALVKPNCSPCSSSVNNCYIRIYLDAIINTLMGKVYEELCCNWQAIRSIYNHSLSILFL